MNLSKNKNERNGKKKILKIKKNKNNEKYKNNKEKTNTKRGIGYHYKLIKKVIMDNSSLLLSHHPNCEVYTKNHVITIKNNRFCIGCFIGYPSALFSIIIGTFIYQTSTFRLFTFLYVGIILFSMQLLSLTKLTEKKGWKIIQKFSMGTGVGFILVFSFFIYQAPMFYRILLIFAIIMLVSAPLSLFHYLTFKKTCLKCEFKNDPTKCPGSLF